jgi:drug/metabolite transporter (DMT)-like permease
MFDTFLPVVLCLISAVTVAATNMFVKRGGDVLTARMAVAIVMGLSVLPFAPFVPLPPAETWSLILVSVVVHWFYQFCLVRALHRGDLSLVFPVMRGLAPLVTAAAAVFVLGEYLTWLQSAGLFLASLAIIVFALPTGQTASARRLDRSALIWALLTALGVGLYAVADTRAARAMPDPMSFVVWLFLLDWIGVTVVTLSQRRGRIRSALARQWKGGVAGGVLGTVSYGLAIYAYTLTDAAIVTALRETSVVFAAALGAIFLKEGFGYRRIVAAAALASGLLLMQAGA